MVPYPRNHDFVGRSDILNSLKKYFDHHMAQSSRLQGAALYGLGGIG